MAHKEFKVIGLMSGSSLDGLDIAYATYQLDENTDTITYQLEVAEGVAYDDRWVNRLKQLHKQDALTFAKTNTYYSHYVGELVNHFIIKNKIQPDFVATHGHTIFHYPDSRVTIQIGDGAALAAITGLPVICDFRTHDIAIDGEGAPIAPIADKYLFSGYDFYLNIGGIANISANINGKYIAFDIAPANQVLNSLAHKLGLPYDKDGQIASQGQPLIDILEFLENIDYYSLDYPKSLDNQWIRKNVTPYFFRHNSAMADKMNTAVEHICQETAKAILNIIEKEGLEKQHFTMFATGGGTFNTFLMKRMEEVFAKIDLQVKIIIPSAEVVEFKEALLMGLMGVLRVENKINCLSTVTGARVDTIGGAIYQGTKKYI